MKLQDVMLRAMAKRITWFQAAEILGISCRQMQRWKTRFEHEGYEGLFDRRRGIPSPKRVCIVALDPGGRRFDDGYARELAACERITLLCGRYEGFDARVLEHVATESLCLAGRPTAAAT